MNVLNATQARIVKALAEQRQRLLVELDEVNAAMLAHTETVRAQLGLEPGSYNFQADGQYINLVENTPPGDSTPGPT